MNNLTVLNQTGNSVNIFRKIFSYRETTVLLVIVVLSAILAIVSPHFLTSSNLSTTALGLASDGIMAIGMCLVLLTGGIDLSVGSVMAASMVITGVLYLNFGVNIWLTSLIAIAYSVFCGFINGIFIGKIGLNAMITTLAMMNMSRGVAYVLSQGSPVSLPEPGEAFTFLGAGNVFGVPMFVIILVIIAVIASYLLNNMGFMRKIYYTGSNQKAAMLSGINTSKVKMGVYIASAVLAGLAGVLSLARFKVATPNAGVSSELRVISACIIGGTSLIGGEGSVIGAVLGVVMLNIINNGLVLLNVSVYWQSLISGLILLIAVTIDFLSQERKQKARLQSK
jgi:ribose transport system permease protein